VATLKESGIEKGEDLAIWRYWNFEDDAGGG